MKNSTANIKRSPTDGVNNEHGADYITNELRPSADYLKKAALAIAWKRRLRYSRRHHTKLRQAYHKVAHAWYVLKGKLANFL